MRAWRKDAVLFVLTEITQRGECSLIIIVVHKKDTTSSMDGQSSLCPPTVVSMFSRFHIYFAGALTKVFTGEPS